MRQSGAAIAAALLLLAGSLPVVGASAGLQFVDIAERPGLRFTHHTGAFGKKYLPETLGAGAVFLDLASDGWQDVLLVNGAMASNSPPPGTAAARSRGSSCLPPPSPARASPAR